VIQIYFQIPFQKKLASEGAGRYGIVGNRFKFCFWKKQVRIALIKLKTWQFVLRCTFGNCIFHGGKWAPAGGQIHPGWGSGRVTNKMFRNGWGEKASLGELILGNLPCKKKKNQI